MKKLLTLILIVIAVSSYSQEENEKKWRKGIGFLPAFTSVFTSNSVISTDLITEGAPTLSAGFSFERKLGKKLYIASGINLLNLNSTFIQNLNFADPEPLINGLTEAISEDRNLDMHLEIPLGIKLYLKKRLYVNIGVSPLVLVATINKNTLSFDGGSIINNNVNFNNLATNLATNLSFGFDLIRIKESFIAIEPKLQYLLKADALDSSYLNSGINLRYQF